MTADDMNPVRNKALEVNLDPLFYGSISEIGAGQEVARNFFHAGGASGTIAKTVSAYDMQFSDAIYGTDGTGRYVTRARLLMMLDKEYGLVIKRVAEVRPHGSRFFAFADTVAAKKYHSDDECHGWVGIRFQHNPGAAPSQVLLHVRMLDASNANQQEALGTLGVNLIHAAFVYNHDVEPLLDSLTDNLVWGRIEIDYIHFDGPGFEGVDNRKMDLRLVSSSLSPVVIFGSGGHGELPADMVHGKHVLILRGVFRPFTNVHVQMIEAGIKGFTQMLGVDEGEVVCLCEMNIARHLSEGRDDVSDLQERVGMITDLGYNVMVTSHLRYFRISEYFSKHVRRHIGFIMSVDNLLTIFDERFYDGMEGGILMGTARLFTSDTTLWVYPNLTYEGNVITVDSLQIPDQHKFLYQHLTYTRRIMPLYVPMELLVPFDPYALAAQIQTDDPRWRELVPPRIHDRITKLSLDNPHS
ncbi:MAG: TonB-dependent receptor [Planctomycetota bacterium]